MGEGGGVDLIIPAIIPELYQKIILILDDYRWSLASDVAMNILKTQSTDNRSHHQLYNNYN